MGGANRSTYGGESLHPLGRIAPGGWPGLWVKTSHFRRFGGAETLPEGLVRDLHVVMQASNQTKDLR